VEKRAASVSKRTPDSLTFVKGIFVFWEMLLVATECCNWPATAGGLGDRLDDGFGMGQNAVRGIPPEGAFPTRLRACASARRTGSGLLETAVAEALRRAKPTE
jgi:hypothetical protein